MAETAKLFFLKQLTRKHDCRKKAVIEASKAYHAIGACGEQHSLCLLRVQSQRFFTQHGFPGFQNFQHSLCVRLCGDTDIIKIDAAILKQRIQICICAGKFIVSCKGPRLFFIADTNGVKLCTNTQLREYVSCRSITVDVRLTHKSAADYSDL